MIAWAFFNFERRCVGQGLNKTDYETLENEQAEAWASLLYSMFRKKKQREALQSPGGNNIMVLDTNNDEARRQ